MSHNRVNNTTLAESGAGKLAALARSEMRHIAMAKDCEQLLDTVAPISAGFLDMIGVLTSVYGSHGDDAREILA